MKWITGFLAVGMATFILFGCVAGPSFETATTPAPAVMPMMAAPAVVQPVVPAPAVIATEVAPVRQPGPFRSEPPSVPQQAFIQIEEEEYSRFSRSGPIRHKQVQKPAPKSIN